MIHCDTRKDQIINDLRNRIEELLSEKRDLIVEANNLDCEVKRLKEVCLNISTEMTAAKMENWNLCDPEQLYEIEEGMHERDILKKEIDRKEKVIVHLQNRNTKLYNKLKEQSGYIKMIRLILAKNTMVVHPSVSKNNCDKECTTRDIVRETNYNIKDDCGGFGMFEPSPPQSP